MCTNHSTGYIRCPCSADGFGQAYAAIEHVTHSMSRQLPSFCGHRTQPNRCHYLQKHAAPVGLRCGPLPTDLAIADALAFAVVDATGFDKSPIPSLKFP